jgi:hypothetical protein
MRFERGEGASMNQSDERRSLPGGARIARGEFLGVARSIAVGGVLTELLWVGQSGAAHLAIPASEGYLLVDTKKCQGCVSCMLACSLVHEGIASLSLARIQVLQNGQWSYENCLGRKLDRAGVEDFKTEFYRLEGWDESTGYPKQQTLMECGLADHAAALAKHGYRV